MASQELPNAAAGGRDDALVQAAFDGRANDVARLLDSGCSINGRGSEGPTPLHAAIENGRVDVVQLLIDRGV